MGEEKKGFFKRLVAGLTKTRDNIVSGIDSIFNGFSNIDDDFIFEFSNRLKDTRNFYTHGANIEKNKKRFTKIEEFLRTSLILDYVIYYYILKALYGEGQDSRIFELPFLENGIKSNK